MPCELGKFDIDFPRKVEVCIIISPYYQDIAEQLLKGASDKLGTHNVKYEVHQVPGSLEIPMGLKMAVGSGKKYDGYILLGCVIRGETYHFDVCVNECMRKVYDIVIEEELALGNGILTVENKDQADVRADISGKNIGGAAAEAALIMVQNKFDLCDLE